MHGWRFLRAIMLLIGVMVIASRSHAAPSTPSTGPLRQSSADGDFVYRFDRPTTGHGYLDLEWTDVFGRVAGRRRIALSLTHQSAIRFHLDFRRAIAVQNELRVRVSLVAVDDKGTAYRHHDESKISFFVRPSQDPWFDYNAILWQPHPADQCKLLRDLGIGAGMILLADKEHPTTSLAESAPPFLTCGRNWYVENIATDFYSPYHRWSPDHPVNWRFAETKRAYDRNPQDLAAFRRAPSLSDPHWQNLVRERLRRIVRAHRAFRPLYYNLADEPGIADLSAFWDFDFSEISLSEMRRWLRSRYGTLGALNDQWGSHFRSWPAVVPMTTAQAMLRQDENYSSWADFKEWMDVAFARAIETGRDAVHAADPGAYAGIEGAQIPGWGGYDYARLAHATDVMEIYDGGGNVEIARALNAKLAILTTSADAGAGEVGALWRALLRGSRGVIFWDPKNKIVSSDGQIGARGRDLAGPLSEIRNGLGALLSHSTRQKSPVAVFYSPASMRTQWMLDWREKGDAWSKRDANAVYEDESAVRSSMARFFALLAHGGLEPHVLVAGHLEGHALRGDGIRVLILPRTLSLSRHDAAEIRRFVATGGTVIADGEPGLFDEHSRRVATPRLSDLFPTSPTGASATFAFGLGTATYFDPGTDAGQAENRDEAKVTALLQVIVEKASVKPIIEIRGKSGEAVRDIETYLWRSGDKLILALQRDPRDLASLTNDTGSAASEPVMVTLPRSFYLYDLRQEQSLGQSDTVELTINPVAPRILALSPTPSSAPMISGPRRIATGEIAKLRLSATTSGQRLLRIDVIDPNGRTIPHYSGNMLLTAGHDSKRLPLALNDEAGEWRIDATDILSGVTASWTMEVVKH